MNDIIDERFPSIFSEINGILNDKKANKLLKVFIFSLFVKLNGCPLKCEALWFVFCSRVWRRQIKRKEDRSLSLTT